MRKGGRVCSEQKKGVDGRTSLPTSSSGCGADFNPLSTLRWPLVLFLWELEVVHHSITPHESISKASLSPPARH